MKMIDKDRITFLSTAEEKSSKASTDTLSLFNERNLNVDNFRKYKKVFNLFHDGLLIQYLPWLSVRLSLIAETPAAVCNPQELIFQQHCFAVFIILLGVVFFLLLCYEALLTV